MPANLFPFLYKAGIKRDGTLFQADYGTEGQWIRFQRGMVKKMGGMKGLNVIFADSANNNIPNIFLASSANSVNFYAYVANSNGNNTQVNKFTINPQFGNFTNLVAVVPAFASTDNNMWQFEIVPIPEIRAIAPVAAVIGDPTKGILPVAQVVQVVGVPSSRKIIAMCTNNATNITEGSAPARIYSGDVDAAVALTQLAQASVPAKANGGMCYAAPYLFVYGSNGYIGYSALGNPLSFPAVNVILDIPADKVIYGKAIRGGSSSPSVLFWTMSSVVRLTNAGTDKVEFKTDTISKSSSIMSSRSVVEYDGLFFWCGTDRFFVYNGVVAEMQNTFNLNYFFDNVDMNFRQKIFGVKNTRFGEIWWFYPTKGQQGVVKNDRAIIYNKRENSWYDTAISRSCGMFFEDSGFLCTYGLPLVNLVAPDHSCYLWRHEESDPNQAWNPAAGGLVLTPIPSSYTSPTFSWVAFPPASIRQQSQLIDRWLDLKRIEPDVVMNNNADTIDLVINTREYAQSPNVASNPITFNRTTNKIDTNVQGRHMSFTFSSNFNFELGNIMLLIGPGDGQ
jgi:hypothetical protein